MCKTFHQKKSFQIHAIITLGDFCIIVFIWHIKEGVILGSMIFKWHIAHKHVLFISAYLEWERMWWQAQWIWSSMHTLLFTKNNDNVIKLHILWKKLDYFLDNAFLMKCKKYWFKEEKLYYFFPPIVLHFSCFFKRYKLGFMCILHQTWNFCLLLFGFAMWRSKWSYFFVYFVLFLELTKLVKILMFCSLLVTLTHFDNW